MFAKLKKPILYLFGFAVGCYAIAQTLTDLQSDAQTQRVVNSYSGYQTSALTAPDQLVCVLRQLWKPEFVGQGNLHVEVNEKQCFGNGDGSEAIQAVVNLSIDPSTGDTVGKIWYDDQASAAYPIANTNPTSYADVVVYIKAKVTRAPTSAEPYGAFEIDVVEEVKSSSEILSIMKIVAGGNDFKVAQKSFFVVGLSNLGEFSAFANRLLKQGAYDDGQNVIAIGYDDTNICFKDVALNPVACRLKASSNPTVTIGSYGIYNADGSRYVGSISSLVVAGVTSTMPDGFGGPLMDVSGQSPVFFPREVTTADTVTMNGNMSMKIQRLAKFVAHSDPGAQGNISMNVDTSQLIVPGTLVDSARSIGALPSAVLNAPLKARGGKLL
jgi:hypothetical protein